MAKSRHAGEDLVSRFGPHERLGARVGNVDIAADGGFQLAGAAMHTPAQLLLRQRCEPALDEIDPRAARRREVHVHAGVPDQPAMDERGFVGTGSSMGRARDSQAVYRLRAANRRR